MGKSRPYAWDAGVDFGEAMKKLTKLLEEMKEKKNDRGVAYVSILIIQLANGARVSEAVEAAWKWVKEGVREVSVRVRKRKDEYERLIVIPPALGEEERKALALVFAEAGGLTKTLLARVKMFCKRRLGYNTHALRYSFITFMGREKKVSPQVIAKMTGHKTLRHIVHYTEKVMAEDLLKEVAGDLKLKRRRSRGA